VVYFVISAVGGVAITHRIVAVHHFHLPLSFLFHCLYYSRKGAFCQPLLAKYFKKLMDGG
jgi:hypothetical protein